MTLGILLPPARADDDAIADDARRAAIADIDGARARLAAPDEAAYGAIQRWLKVSPSTDYYAATIAQAQDTLTKLKGRLLAMSLPHDNQCPHGAGDLGCAAYGESTVHLTDTWFASGPLCRRSVLLHEAGHTIGLVHTYIDPSKGEAGGTANLKPTAQMTREESLKNANSMAQLAQHLATASYDACSSGK